MKQMTPFQQIPTHKKQAGNVFFAIFGAIAVVGLLGAGLTTFVGGPLSSSVTLTRESAAQNQMVIGAQTALMAAASQTAAGDCDLDMFVEPMPWRSPGGSPAPAGGGLIPSNIPAPKRDPWGTDYGYCVWDHGPTIDDAACGGPTQNRLIGTNSRAYPSLALISAGPDRIFQTTCADFTVADANGDGDLEDVGDTKLVYKSAGSDDMIFSYSYDEAVAATGDMWVLKSSDPDTAMLDKKLEIVGGAQFTGVGDFIGVTADTFMTSAADFINLPGIRIPDRSSYGAACTPALEGVIRTNLSSVNPPAVISSATDAQGFRDADTASVTFHSRPIAGNTVVVTVRGYAAGGFALTAGNVMDNDGNTYVAVGSTGTDAADSRVMMFAAYNITGSSSALTVSINPTGGTASGVLAALEVSGIAASSLDITGADSSANGTVTASGTTAHANEMAIGVIGIFGADNVNSAITHNSAGGWQQPIVKNNIPSMAVVTRTFPSAGATVAHTWGYNPSTVTAVRKFMAVFRPASGGPPPPPTGPSVVMGVNWVDGSDGYDLTSFGFTDWARWTTSSWTPTNRKSGGGNLISNATVFGGGSPAHYSDGPFVWWTGDGTPTATSSTQDGVYNNSGTANRGYNLTFPADTTTKIAKIYMGYYNADTRITAIISDGSTPDQIINTANGGNPVGEITITYRAASAGQTLTVRVQTTTAGGNVALQAAGIDDGTGGLLGPPGPITMVQRSAAAISSTSAWISPDLPNPVTAGNTIIVPVTSWNGEVFTVYDDRGNTYTKVADSLLNNMTRAYIWVANNVAGGPTTINVTSGGGSQKSIAAYEFSGLANDDLQLVDRTGAFQTTGGTSATVTASGATRQADELVFALAAPMYNDAALTIQTDPSYTTHHIYNNGQSGAIYSSVYKILSATETPSHTWTFDPPYDAYQDVVATMVTLRGQIGLEAGGGGGGGDGGSGIDCDDGVIVEGLPLEGGPGSPGPITVVQKSAMVGHGSYDGNPGVETLTFPVQPQAGNAVIIMTALSGVGNPINVYDNQGNRYLALLDNDAEGQNRNQIFIAENIKAPVGALVVTVSKGSAQGNLTAGMMEVAGLAPVNTRDRFGAVVGTGGTGVTVTANGATTTTDQLVIASHITQAGAPNNLNYARQGGWSEGFTQNNPNTAAGHSSVYRVSSAIETPSHAWTYASIGGGRRYGAGIVTLRGYTAPPVAPTAAAVINQTPIGEVNVVSFARSPQEGSTIIVAIQGWANTNPFRVNGVTDNQGNTYTLVAGTSNYAAHNRNIYLYAAYNIAAPSGVFTITAATDPNPMLTTSREMSISAMEVVGLLPSGVDATHVTSHTGTSRTITLPGTTAEANEFAVAFSGGIINASPMFDIMNNSTWNPIQRRMADTVHSLVTKEIPAAGTSVSHVWDTQGNNGEVTFSVIATFRTDPDYVYTPPPTSFAVHQPARLRSTSYAYPAPGRLDVALPAGTVAGDLLVWIASVDGGASDVWPYGFAPIRNIHIPEPDSHGLAAAWKIADGTEPGTLAKGDGSWDNVSFVMRYTGFDPAQPIDISTSTARSGELPFAASWPAVAPSIATTVPNARVVWAAVTDHGAVPEDYPVVYDAPPGFHARAELRHTQYTNLAVADKVFPASGSTGTLNGVAFDSWAAGAGPPYGVQVGTIAFAIRPGEGGGSSHQPGQIQYVGSDAARATSPSSLVNLNVNVTAPGNIAVGDVIILTQSSHLDTYAAQTSTITWPAGFTQGNQIILPTGSQQVSWAWKVSDGSESVMTVSSSRSWGTDVLMSVYRGADPASPIGVHSGYIEAADAEFSWPYSVPGVTVPTADSALVLIPFGETNHEWGANYGAKYFTAPDSFIERQNGQDGTNGYAPMALFDSTGVAAGATGNIAGAMRNQSVIDKTNMFARAGGFLLSLNPDPDPPPPVAPDPPSCSASIMQICDGSQWRAVATAVTGGGIALDQNNNAVCDVSSASTVRYNTTALRPEYCNGSNWLPFALSQSGVVLVADTPLLTAMNSVNNNWSTTRIVTITNRGSMTSGPLGVSLTGADMAAFDYAGLLGTSTCDNVTGLAPGASCTYAVRARANTDGYYTANLEVTEATSSVVITMSGSATQNTVCAPGKLGFGGIIVSCVDSTTPYYVLTGSGCGVGTNEPACTNTPGVAVDPKFTMNTTSGWINDNFDLITQNRDGDKNTVNILTYSAGWNAATYCNNLIKDGYTNWYLPSSEEWMTLLAPMRDQLMLDDANQAYWTSTFAYLDYNNLLPYHTTYMRNDNELLGWYAPTSNSNTRCLRKHGESMPSAGADNSINRPKIYFFGPYTTDVYGTVFRPLYSTSLNTQLTGVVTTMVGLNTMVPIAVSGPGSPEFRSRPPAGAWSGYGTSGTVGPGYEVQLRANTPAVAGQEHAVNVVIGNGSYVWKVRAIQAATRQIFVTSTTHNGNLGGFSGADSICMTRAAAAALGGTWYALLGGVGTNAFDRVPWNWNRLETRAGVQVAANMGDLEFSSTILSAINRNESNVATTTTNVWTGTRRSQLFYGYDDYGDLSCSNTTTWADWGSNAAGRNGAIGTINNTTNWMAPNTQNACNQTRRLYCVGPF